MIDLDFPHGNVDLLSRSFVDDATFQFFTLLGNELYGDEVERYKQRLMFWNDNDTLNLSISTNRFVLSHLKTYHHQIS